VGRPSLETVRTRQIVAAASRAIVAHGVNGATLERIAEEAGLRRGHVRHYVGNRAELLDLVIDAAIQPYRARVLEIARVVDRTERIQALLAHMFGSDWGPGEDTAVFTALLLGAHHDMYLHERMRAYYEELRQDIEKILKRDAQGPARKGAPRIAYAVLCLAYGNTVMTELAVAKPGTRMTREMAEAVIAGLVGEESTNGK
jgi:TetR/AcrR family transcriptional regulator, transcriptional repressor of bet genes